MLSKFKDYTNELEKILDKKTFSSISKSLFLSMIYKLEISYKDYERVNKSCISKEAFFDNILNVIENYCEHIKIVEPDSSQAVLLSKNKVNVLTNSKERSILTYPTEVAMLEAIVDIEPKYYFVRKDFLYKKTLQNLLVQGYKQNTMQILKNFNGWSWDVNSNENMDYVTNLVYQNIMMIKGEKFLYKWRTDLKSRRDYLEDLKQTLLNNKNNYYIVLEKLLDILSKNEKDKLKDTIVELQKYFLLFIEKRIEKVMYREEILGIIYDLRYYQNLNFDKGCLVKDCVELNKMLKNVMKLAITKACKLGIIKIVSMDIESNFRVIEFILDTHIIDLEQIKIEINVKEENILIEVYDKEVFEKEGKLELNGSKKDIAIRKKRRVNLFN